jgi:hypothetical protein
MWIMVAGPYTSGAETPAARAANLRVMNDAAHRLLQRGHVPIIGVNLALPIIEAAGAASFDEIMMPLSLALAERCDAVLRTGGPSMGADLEVRVFARAGKPIYRSLDEIPDPR